MTARPFVLVRVWLLIGFVACAVLFYLCLMPSPPTPDVTDIDKIEHFVAYLLLGTWFGGLLAPRYWRVFFGLVAFGAIIEIVQEYSGYRSGDLYDLAADTLGVIAGLGLAHLGALGWLGYIDARVAAKRNHSGS